jgi:hypothetical protein
MARQRRLLTDRQGQPFDLHRLSVTCLTAPLAGDDPAEWRGAVSRAEQEELSERLETAFNELRDRDFMQLDSTGWLMVAVPAQLPSTHAEDA